MVTATVGSAPAPPSGRWLIYIHDRDADGNGTLDEAKVGGTTTRFLPDPSGTNPLFVRLTEVRLSLDSTGRALAFSVFDGTNWQLWYVADVQAPNPTLVAQSLAPFSIPSLAGSASPSPLQVRCNSQALINPHHRAFMSWTPTLTKPSLSRLTA